MANAPLISVEVACALPEKQLIIKLEVPLGTGVRKAIELSGIEKEFPQLDIPNSAVGIFGEVVKDTHPLKKGDRVEIYRPLINEPRETRRILAAKGATMGGKVSG
jgi:putative ubiquitin-RnfH superfamily antitoxin RatB of RatAB toxin-antitoxin module